jgi:hypothetical protein
MNIVVSARARNGRVDVWFRAALYGILATWIINAFVSECRFLDFDNVLRQL